MAQVKQSIDSGKDYIEDDSLGHIKFDPDNILTARTLDDHEITMFNKQMDKKIYVSKYYISEGHIRYGEKLVNHLLDLSYDYYSSKSKFKWTRIDKVDCTNWTWIPLDYMGGMYDPRRHKIFCPEIHFDITIDKPWAKYNYEHMGETLTGNLAIKGTIDLIVEHEGGILEVVDWKGLPLSTKIPTPNGWTTMGEIKVGDKIFDEDGQQCNVIGKSKVKTKDCFRITFDDTTSVVCDDEHLWKLSDGTVLPITELKVGHSINVAKHLDGQYLDLGPRPDLYDDKRKAREITLIEKSITQQTQCISVDSPTNTYLCTENYIPTHNTGQRRDWAKNKKKSYDDLCNDFQLMLYYYALKQKFPHIDHIIVSIFFIRDGGPFTVTFDDSILPILESRLEQRFKEIQKCVKPELLDASQKDFRCNRICDFYKNKLRKTDKKNLCKTIHEEINQNGMDWVIKKYAKKDINEYQNPGE